MLKIRSLGIVTLPPGTVEHDFAMLAKFQEYSAELLRLALLGISAISIALSFIISGNSGAHSSSVLALLPAVKCPLIVALVAFAACAAAALLHRYFSADSLAWHIEAMRRFCTEDPAQHEKAAEGAQRRYARFRHSNWALVVAASGLGVGASFLAIAVILAICRL